MVSCLWERFHGTPDCLFNPVDLDNSLLRFLLLRFIFVEPHELVNKHFFKHTVTLATGNNITLWRRKTVDTYGVNITIYNDAKAEARRLEEEERRQVEGAPSPSPSPPQRKCLIEEVDDDDLELLEIGVGDYFQRYMVTKHGKDPTFHWVHRETFRVEEQPSSVMRYMHSMRRQELIANGGVFKREVRPSAGLLNMQCTSNSGKGERCKQLCRQEVKKKSEGNLKLNFLSVKRLYEAHMSYYESAADLPVMETVSHKLHFGIESNWKPRVDLTVMNAVNGDLYDFELKVRKSRIENAGYGAFITLKRVRKLNESAGRSLLQPSRPKVMLATVEGGSYPMNVTIKCDRLADAHTKLRAKNLVESENAYAEHRGNFNSFTLGNGKIEIGRYAPFLKRHRKPNYLFAVKDFIFGSRPSWWAFDAKSAYKCGNQSCIHKLDITDDFSGQPSQVARGNIPMYINEVGNRIDLAHNVLATDFNETCVKYSFVTISTCRDEDGIWCRDTKDMRIGRGVEMLTWYTKSYENVREREGYGIKNILGDVKVRKDARLDRVVAGEQKDLTVKLNPSRIASGRLPQTKLLATDDKGTGRHGE